MADQDVGTVGEGELQLPFASLAEDQEFQPFMFQVELPVTKKTSAKVWVQARDKREFDELQSNDHSHYGKKYQVAITQDCSRLLPKGSVVQVTHRGFSGTPIIDAQWVKSTLFAAKIEGYADYLPEMPLDAQVCNDITGILRANDGVHPLPTFSNDFFG